MARRASRTQKGTDGFTIVELLVVVVVIAILAAITVVSYNGVAASARDTVRKSDVRSITQALELYYADNGQYPTSNGGSTAINSGWSTTADASWEHLRNQLVPKYMSALGSDPSNTPGVSTLTNAAARSYSYFTGSYCGSTIRQMYILVYRLDSGTQSNHYEGSCDTNPIGYGSSSNWRVVR